MIHSHTFENSLMLRDCSYDDDTSELSVTFNNGRTYTYEDVAKYIYDGLISAESPGKYFNSIKKDLSVKV
jgi:KTSC domain